MTTLAQKPGVSIPLFSRQSSFTRSSDQDTSVLQQLISRFISNPSDGISQLALYQERGRINALGNLADNWDSFGSAKPNPASIQNALVQIESLYQSATSTGLPWIEPHISASEIGDVVFEWWCNDHKLTVYVGPDSLEYIQVWGLDIVNEMSDGIIQGNIFQILWQWLRS